MSTDYAITEETLINDVQSVIYDSDLRTITQRAVFQRLQDKYGILLPQFKALIYERAIEEARIRIKSSPELQKQQAMSNPKYDYTNTEQQTKYYNTIYNTPDHSTNTNDTHSHKIKKKHKKEKIINYKDVKKHYIGNGNYSSTPEAISTSEDESSEYESDSDSGSEEEPQSKRRKYNLNTPKRKASAQSKREAQKDIVYEFSSDFKQIMGKSHGTWRECWDWIIEYTEMNDLRISNRKIKCDGLLSKAFNRTESSVSGVSRLIWKHLLGAVEVDENGNPKKLVYKKRAKKEKNESDLSDKKDRNGGNSNGNKRRYRKRLRDENGEIIKKRKNSGLTRLCFMSQALKDICGESEPRARNKITKSFWAYCDRNGLKRQGRIIVCDEKLKRVFGEESVEVHMYQVQKGLAGHLTTMKKEEETKYKRENPQLFSGEETE